MITVVIPTRNRADLLGPALESIITQDMDQSRFEVLVIDNGSTDDTRRVIDEYKSRLLNLEGIYAPDPGLHVGRHAGMKAARGDILVFADDDIEALPTWLSSIDEAFRDPLVAMVGGNNHPMFLSPPPAWLIKLWHRRAWRGFRAISSLSVIEFGKRPKVMSPFHVWGCNFAIRKDVLLAAGGFHPDGMPKELIKFRGDGETHVSEYVAKSGLKCVFHPGASVRHKVTPDRMTYAYFRQRGFSQGISDSYTSLRKGRGGHVAAPSASVKSVLRRMFVRMAHTIEDQSVIEAFKQRDIGHKEGFTYHQAAYHDDPEVRDWVHRPTYF